MDVLALVPRMERVFQIDAGQDGENIGLNAGNQHLKPGFGRRDRRDLWA